LKLRLTANATLQRANRRRRDFSIPINGESRNPGKGAALFSVGVRRGIAITNRDFLEVAFGHMAENEYAAITSFGGDPYTVPKQSWFARPWWRGLHVPRSVMGRPQNVYLAVSSFKIGDDGRFHRRKDDFAEMHIVMVDDVFEKVDRKKLKLPPSAMIQTSPRSAQAFYFLNPSPESRIRSACEGLVDTMIRSGLTSGGADPGMRGCTRLGRLPNGVNAKGKYVAQLGHPFKCRLTHWNPERRYTIPEIAKAFRLGITGKVVTPGRSGTYTPSMELSPTHKLPRGEATKRVNEFERMMKVLADEGMYVASRGPWHDIICPWVAEHTDQKAGGSALCIPAASNDWLGGYKCWHGHCEHRTVGDLYKFVHLVVRGAT
jgi:hypothetical protein